MMRRDKTPILLLFLGAIFSCSFIAADAPAQTESCVTAKCHASMGKDKTVHNPVKEGMCTTCHLATKAEGKTKHPGNLTISLIQQGAELCSMCHEPKNKKRLVHAPIMAGDCTSCHNPHQSPHKGMLKESVPKLCFQCHPPTIVKQQVMHPPVAAGDCSGCHDNHESDFPGRLVQGGNALCFTCHPDKEEGVNTKKSVHTPVKQSCVLCHSPHGSANKAILTSAIPAICSNCHPNEAAMTQRALTRHAPMNDARICMNCHDPHFSDVPKLLPRKELDLCLGCHDKELGSGQETLTNMKAFLNANKNGHGPVKNGHCAGCHNPHGSDYWRILAKYYPPEFYTSYSEGKYALCFSCHDKNAFARLHADKETGFRDGRKNLHFVHVNKHGKGRTCRACHEVHADTGKAKHVKDVIGFGRWSMPMNYSPARNGGSCAPGCHGEKRYTR
jgi:predicted CXXCH cytochrome family protein